MATPRKAFCDADFWINLARVDAIDLLFELYDEIYMAREVKFEIMNFKDDAAPDKWLGKKVKADKIKIIDLEDFPELTVLLIKQQREEYEFKIGFIKEGTKNLGELASVQYAQELNVDILMSDDKNAKPILESDFNIIIRDHNDLLIEAESMKLIKTLQAEAIYNAIEKLKDKPSESNYFLMKKLRKEAG